MSDKCYRKTNQLKRFINSGFLILCILFVNLLSLSAQALSVKGTVTDANSGEALPGVNVVIEGTGGGTGITGVKNSIMAQMDSCIYNLVVGSSINITNNNYFNTKGLADYTPQSAFFLLDPAFIDPNNGDFTLPFGSPLATADESGAAIGDPRWAPN